MVPSCCRRSWRKRGWELELLGRVEFLELSRQGRRLVCNMDTHGVIWLARDLYSDCGNLRRVVFSEGLYIGRKIA